MSHPMVLIIDIDGVLFKHKGTGHADQAYGKQELLPQTVETLDLCEKAGHQIVLFTSRKECERDALTKQLEEHKVYYDKLVMGINWGARLLINDQSPRLNAPAAQALTLERNKGLELLKGRI